ncbi:unnamed protein product [Adineta steineri]|uniref:Interferon-induced transmembrane protein n=1 Tax=Adineta steineri TaxID=433720 RepID=A0A814HW01_9BILA|nr:unnamed protein product [Adineta steineri]CAF1128186.1 unnamed protein product [Adineta steineri]
MSYDKQPPPYPPYGGPSYPPYAGPSHPPYAGQSYPAYGAPAYSTPVAVANPFVGQAGPNVGIIRDYLAWSIINLCCGWGFLGFIPLVFSILCRNSKSVNNYNQARTMSTCALVSNIIVTIGGVIGWITFIIFMGLYIGAASHFSYN